MNKLEKKSSIIMSVFGIGLILNLLLIQFFNIGLKSNIFTLIYCVLFVLMTIQFKSIIRKKYVMIPLFILIIQTSYSLITTYILKL
ncbi:MAG: hypothetical protein CMF98_05190 [Candidatus Marinimicrobia bacterium]|nr:hypothetical protein [Candidatus Neomarinimicrobiota bacterium]